MSHTFTIQQQVGPERHVVLTDYMVLALFAIAKLPDSPKPHAIRFLREGIQELGLKEAKDIVDFIADNGAIQSNGHILLTYRKPAFTYTPGEPPIELPRTTVKRIPRTPVAGMKLIGPANDGGTHYDCGTFMAQHRNRYIVPSDGSGYWANATHYSHSHPVFGSITMTDKPSWATHVMWFNK